MQRFKNHSLKNFNTFGIDAKAATLIMVEQKDELKTLYNEKIFSENFLVLGYGSNILFTKDFNGTVLKLNLLGTSIVKEDEKFKYIESASGEDWDAFVEYTIQNQAYGLENLSLIPGSVGASAVQNIGAYGVEAKDFIEEVEYFDIEEGESKIISNSEINFSYRDSIFKNKLKNKAIITNVVFKLSKQKNLKLEYADLQSEISSQELNPEELTPEIVRNLVIEIRRRKLHDPKELGNAGSFFKNPIISIDEALNLQKSFPDLKFNKVNDHEAKLSAGWLIEQSGWKGWTSQDHTYGVSPKHALVLVNYNNANGSDILNLSKSIKESVFNKFKVNLEEEAIII